MQRDAPAAGRFLAQTALIALLLLLTIAGINALIDPYALFARPVSPFVHCAGGYRTPAVDAVRFGLTRSAADVLIAGNSRMLMGHETTDPALRSLGGRVFNFGFGGATIDATQQRVAQSTGSHAPRVLVIGFGVGEFLGSPDTGSSQRPPAAWRIAVGGLLGSPATSASLSALRHPEVCAEPARTLDGDIGKPPARRNLAPPDAAIRTRSVEHGVAQLYASRRSLGAAPDPASIRAFAAMLRDACGRGGRVLAFVQPTHARLMEIVWQSDLWPAFEAIKRETLRAIEQERARGCDAQLWDFSGYNEFTTEQPPVPGTEVYFSESSHYTPRLGRLLTRAMIASEETGIGKRLSAENLQPHLTALRAQREAYLRLHPALSAEMARLVASARGARGAD